MHTPYRSRVPLPRPDADNSAWKTKKSLTFGVAMARRTRQALHRVDASILRPEQAGSTSPCRAASR